MNELTPEQLEKLESAHVEVFGKGHGAAKTRLLAALPPGCPPAPSSLWHKGISMARRSWFQTALAASVAVAAISVWQFVAPPQAIAQAAKALKEAKGFVCDMQEVSPGADQKENVKKVGVIIWSATGGDRIDAMVDGVVQLTRIQKPEKTVLTFMPNRKTYQIHPSNSRDEFSISDFLKLANYQGKADQDLGEKDVHGVKAKGFAVAWSKVTGDDSIGTMRVWIDPAKGLPVRIDLDGFPGVRPGFMRVENFVWGEQDAKLFDLTPPAGYKEAKASMPSAEEITTYINHGLAAYVKYNGGKYPQVKRIYGDQHGEQLRKIIGVGKDVPGWIKPEAGKTWADPKQGEFAYGSYGMSWINTLQRENEDCAYYGRTVTSNDAGKVLFRWKLTDGRYRVIFGDTKAETVSAERLKELEKEIKP